MSTRKTDDKDLVFFELTTRLQTAIQLPENIKPDGLGTKQIAQGGG
jgi:hypothetical protein